MMFQISLVYLAYTIFVVMSLAGVLMIISTLVSGKCLPICHTIGWWLAGIIGGLSMAMMALVIINLILLSLS